MSGEISSGEEGGGSGGGKDSGLLIAVGRAMVLFLLLPLPLPPRETNAIKGGRRGGGGVENEGQGGTKRGGKSEQESGA